MGGQEDPPEVPGEAGAEAQVKRVFFFFFFLNFFIFLKKVLSSFLPFIKTHSLFPLT